MEILVRIVAPHFVAGLVIRDDKCVEAAPILAWAVGKRRRQLSDYFKRRGWKAAIVSTQS